MLFICSRHCANLFLRPDHDNPRANAGCASQTAGRKLVLGTDFSNSSLPWGGVFGVATRFSYLAVDLFIAEGLVVWG
jgi:hypothetical protein